MAWHFARLKLALLLGGLKVGGPQQVIGLVVGTLLALPLTAGGFVLLAALRGAPANAAEAVAVIGFSFLALAWAVLPLLTFAADSALDPAKLVLLPLRPRQLAVGLLVASCVGVPPLATLLALSGGVVGFAPAGPGLVVVAVAVVLEFALCVLAARALTTALSRWLRTRRVRDLTIVVVSLGALALNLGVQVLVRSRPSGLSDLGWLRSLGHALGWLPPGLAARAMATAGRGGSLPVAALELAGAAAAVLLLAWWWYASLRRVLTTAEPSSQPRRSGTAARPTAARPTGAPPRGFPDPSGRGGSPDPSAGLFPRAVRGLLPLDRRGAVAAKDLRYFARHPRLRVLWLTAAVFAVVLPGFLLLSRDGPRELAALGALASLYMLNSSALNQFGPDGPAYWVNVAAGGSSRADLVGKNLALALPGFALVAVVSIALSAVGGGWVYLPVTLCLAAGILGIILGVANYVSIRFPFALSNVSSNVWASQGAGAGCAIGLVQLLAMAVEGALMLPLGILLVVGLVAWPPALAILCPLAVAYGYTLWRLGVGLGTEWLDAHQPELLAALSPRRGG
jgi:ABC-2 type transport system permease protein